MTRRVIELVGPAGAGKTTLVNELLALDASATVGVSVGPLGLAAGMAAAAPAVAAARMSTEGRFWTAAELRNLAYLHAWRGPLTHGSGTVLLDHGPVFRLAYLTACGPPMTSTPAFRRWWGRTSRSWAKVLDTVVWLDAPDDVLIHRIDARDRAHRVRGANVGEAAEFLSRYRAAYRSALDILASEGTHVVCIDTSRASAPQTASVVRAALGHQAPDHQAPAGLAR